MRLYKDADGESRIAAAFSAFSHEKNYKFGAKRIRGRNQGQNSSLAQEIMSRFTKDHVALKVKRDSDCNIAERRLVVASDAMNGANA